MCGPADERHPVPSASEHGAIKAANGACANYCNVVARSSQRGRLYVFAPRGELPWSGGHRLHLQLVADLAGVAASTMASI